ncbi:MAG: sugar transporter, partial [Burkholderiales bacterium]
MGACMALAGCVSSPGMTIRTSLSTPEPGGVPLPQWLRAHEPRRDANGVYIEEGRQAQAILLPITPDLLRLQRASQPAIADDLKALLGPARPYTIGPGDVLTIIVWDHPEIQARPVANSNDASGVLGVLGVPGYSVSPEGLVQFPYVGTVQVAGLTELQARQKLATALGRFFNTPQVTLQVQAYRSGRVYVEGEVRNPGLQAVNDVATTLPLALGRAGSLLPTADRSGLTLTRAGQTTRIDLQQLTASGIDPAGIVLQNGDIVRVMTREDSKIHVLGEVLKSGPQLMRNGRLTLNEALGDAGGINPVSADPRQIYVVRSGAATAEGGATSTEVYHLDAVTAANYALAEGFELKPRDVVFVDPVPLVNWNRVISLIIPSAVAITTT